jgi:hypothetical protein
MKVESLNNDTKLYATYIVTPYVVCIFCRYLLIFKIVHMQY